MRGLNGSMRGGARFLAVLNSLIVSQTNQVILRSGATFISQKMLAQQLWQLEAHGILERTVHQQVPPKVDYRMTAWGHALCPALDALLKWAEQCDKLESEL